MLMSKSIEPPSRASVAAVTSGFSPFLLLVPFFYLVMSALISRPFVFPDEAGAITNARFVAGQGAASPWWYLPGYGALVAPVLLFTRDLELITWAFQTMNAALGLISAVGLYRIGINRFPDLGERRVALASVVVLLYPSFQYFATLAIADNLLIAAGIWSVIIVRWMLRRGQTAATISAALAFGLVASSHSRAAVIIVAAAIVLMLEKPTRRLGTGMLFSGAISTLIARSFLAADVETFHSLGGRQSFVDLIGANASIRSIAVLPFSLLGQVINLTASTAGLVVVGMIAIGATTWRAKRPTLDEDGDLHVLVLVGLAAVLSALFTNQGQGDLAVYGRYLEVVMPIPLLVGLLILLDRSPPKWMTSAGPAVLVVSACVLVAVRGYEAFETRLQILNVSGLGLPIRLTNRIDPILIALFGAAMMLFIARVSAKRTTLVLPLLLLLFFTAATLPFERSMAYIDRVSNEGELTLLLEQARVSGATGCVGLDQTELRDPWAHENYQMLLLDVPFEYFYSDRDVSPCDDLVISSRPDLGTVLAGWRAIGWEQGRGHWLWASPAAMSGLGQQQAIFPDPGTRLASLAADLSIELVEEDSGDRTIEALVTVTNASSSTFIPPSRLPVGGLAVRLGVEWRATTAEGERIHEPVRFDITEPLRPGASEVVLVSLTRDLVDLSVDDGTWVLRAELVQEFVQWAGDSAADSVTIELGAP